MKYIKLFEDIDWNWDEEEEFTFEGDYYLTYKKVNFFSSSNLQPGTSLIILTKIYIEKDNSKYIVSKPIEFKYKNFHTKKIIFSGLNENDIKEDLDKKKKYNSIYLFELKDWGTDDMKKIFKRLTNKDLPSEYSDQIITKIKK